MNVALVTYASGDPVWHLAAKRLLRQAKNTGHFYSMEKYDSWRLKKIATEPQMNFIKSHKHGGGFWLWKPIIILDFLRNNQDVDAIFYMDAGCEINMTHESLKELEKIVDIIQTQDAVVYEMEHTEKKWSKKSLTDFLESPMNILESGQLLGGLHLMRREFATTFCEEWLDVMQREDHKYLIGDLEIEHLYMKAHRHDQSIFSLLMKTKENISILDSNREVYFDPYWELGVHKPIWTSRRKSMVHTFDNRKISKLIRLGERIISKLYNLSISKLHKN